MVFARSGFSGGLPPKLIQRDHYLTLLIIYFEAFTEDWIRGAAADLNVYLGDEP